MCAIPARSEIVAGLIILFVSNACQRNVSMKKILNNKNH